MTVALSANIQIVSKSARLIASTKDPIFLVINPDECIDCALCEPECPVDAIYSEDELPEDEQAFLDLNAELAEVWPNITEKQDPLPDAEDWAEVKGKIGASGEIRTASARPEG